MEKRYGLILLGKVKPTFFNTKKERSSFVRRIKGLITYTTFTEERRAKRT